MPRIVGRLTMSLHPRVAVYGAYGHTAHFVIAELRRRGWAPVLSGRNAERLQSLATEFPGLERRPASVDDPASLDRAFGESAAVINCAGPFLETAMPVLDCALRKRIHYLDVTAEQPAALAVLGRDAEAQAAGITAIPAMGFFGGLGDLLATAALGDWKEADEIRVAVALDSWHPTAGTRLTGKRNTAPRKIFTGGAFAVVADPLPAGTWSFPAPFGTQDVVGLPFSEIAILARHIRCAEMTSWINLTALRDVRNSATPPPAPADASGRSAQQFAVDVQVRKAGTTRRAVAQGRDIYAISAPLMAEAVQRILAGRLIASGAVAPGQSFDSRDFLASVARDCADFEIELGSR
jgi:hypothetical protein